MVDDETAPARPTTVESVAVPSGHDDQYIVFTSKDRDRVGKFIGDTVAGDTEHL
ncbi:MAG: hypothetical protein M9896_18795 [Candidatus Promineofilum sp.]|uniref:hypothetical protein n=1 Tax=Promineifilum sp. TaxID=2664178 RepID=UPI0024120B84|nr:hypothetical protein [Promineifilum sp.]